VTWSAVALCSELLRTWIGGTSSGILLYTSLQMVLFLVALGFPYDFATLNSVGASWRRIIHLYRVKTWRQRVAYAGSLALATIGLITQVQSGAGSEATKPIWLQ
jgi:hypothetical protein